MDPPEKADLDALDDESRRAKLLRKLHEDQKSGSCTKEDLAAGIDPTDFDALRDAWECLEMLEEIEPSSSDRQVPPQILAHYRLEQRIGAGGMGEVYLATDLALGRRCALKILPPDFPGHLKDRLLHEARTCAKLQHPSIAAFYEAGIDREQAFIAMEYVDGETLRRRLRNGPLPKDQCLSVVACLLNGLGHAHALGILHRDIKPENIMFVGEHSAKFVDFGLAKTMTPDQDNPSTASMLTEQGAIVGTVGYMSPEQLRGQQLDSRSDLFSVGAVLYEAISGHPAFPGRNLAERMAAILSSDPELLTGSSSITQINLILKRALAKDRKHRYPTAAAFLNDLSLLASGGLQIDWPNSLVVMDFENISASVDDDWIGVGVAESISAELGREEGIEVKPRGKLAQHLADRGAHSGPPDLQTAGLTLGCRWMIGGGFQKMGNALRFTVFIKELLTDTDVFTAKIDGTVEGIFALQDRLTDLIRSYLSNETSLNSGRSSSAVSRPKSSAYECYVKGRQEWQKSGKADFDVAQDYFEQAIEIDSNYALAYAGLATVNALRFTYTTESTLIENTKAFAKKALSLDPNLSEAHVWLGYAYVNENDLQQAFAQQLKAVRLDSESLFGHYFAGGCLNASHSSDSALRLFRQVNPSTSIDDPHRWRFDQAVGYFQSALRISPNHGWSFLGASTAHLALDQFTESRICLERARDLDPRFSVPGVEGFLGETLRRIREYDLARKSALAGIDAVDASDSMYRDTLRAIFLCCLGRAAYDEGNLSASAVAFNQAVQHLLGRNRARGGGHPLVQALAGLARAENDRSAFDKSLEIYRNPGDWSFHYLPLCSNDKTLCALAAAATKLGLSGVAAALRDEAIDFGSFEAQDLGTI